MARLHRARALALASPLLLGACSAGDDATGATSTSAAASTSADGTAGSTSTAAETATSTGATTGATSDATSTGGPLACNGHPELCDRRLDQVTFPATHNSFAATDEGFPPINANHHRPVAQQLADGVRGLLLDVTLDGDQTTLCHGPCFLASIPHADLLADLADFLAQHPREIVLIIYQDDVDAALVESDFIDAGLDALVWTWDGGPMPTLGAMIDAGTRLVVTAEVAGPPPAWYHHAWDVFWDTPYTFHSAAEFTCDLNRGAVDNPLFLVNHWLSTDLDLPSEDGAKEVNAYAVLHARASECAAAAGRPPTLLAVDFYESGDLFAVVDALNGL